MNTTSPITVLATIVATKGNETAVRDALVTLATATRGEAGNIAYRVVQGAEDAAQFVTIERWKSADDLTSHMQQPHVGAALAACSGMLASAPAIVSYTELTPA